jgi:hypothetical protein
MILSDQNSEFASFHLWYCKIFIVYLVRSTLLMSFKLRQNFRLGVWSGSSALANVQNADARS